ncbi:hypothetical protein CABS01_16403, partial [Colletotrichum abscissum]|uniref:uncharacterized protein n=1 Tax=Colletotrichum abscissum TaxID=1671311 RepID=UPI0027D5FF45
FIPCTAIKLSFYSTQEPSPIVFQQSTALSAGTCASPERVGFPTINSRDFSSTCKFQSVGTELLDMGMSTASQSPAGVTGRTEAHAIILASGQNNGSIRSARDFQCEPLLFVSVFFMAKGQVTRLHDRVLTVRSGFGSTQRLCIQISRPGHAFTSFRYVSGLDWSSIAA